MKTLFKTLVVVAGASVLLGGCAVYQPAPVAVQPAPVYVGPPVTFGLNFGYWGGGHHHGHYR